MPRVRVEFAVGAISLLYIAKAVVVAHMFSIIHYSILLAVGDVAALDSPEQHRFL